MEDRTISLKAAIDMVNEMPVMNDNSGMEFIEKSLAKLRLELLPSAQPEYEELTPEEAASEIASGSTMSAWYWLDDMIRLKQMGYAICRKR